MVVELSGLSDVESEEEPQGVYKESCVGAGGAQEGEIHEMEGVQGVRKIQGEGGSTPWIPRSTWLQLLQRPPFLLPRPQASG